jgi:hypothetical protein
MDTQAVKLMDTQAATPKVRLTDTPLDTTLEKLLGTQLGKPQDIHLVITTAVH